MSRRFSVQRPALSRRHARWKRLYFQQFFGARFPTPASLRPSPCLNFAASSTWSLRRSQSSLCTARCHLMRGFEKKVSLTGDREFESVSLQQASRRRRSQRCPRERATAASWHRTDEARAYYHPEQAGSGFHQVSNCANSQPKRSLRRAAASITNVNPWLVPSQPCSDLLIRRRFDGHPND